MKKLIIKLLVMLSITSSNLEKKYLKKYGWICHNNNLCVELYDTCECEQKNIFRIFSKKIGVYIWRLENFKYYLKNIIKKVKVDETKDEPIGDYIPELEEIAYQREQNRKVGK